MKLHRVIYEMDHTVNCEVAFIPGKAGWGIDVTLGPTVISYEPSKKHRPSLQRARLFVKMAQDLALSYQ